MKGKFNKDYLERVIKKIDTEPIPQMDMNGLCSCGYPLIKVPESRLIERRFWGTIVRFYITYRMECPYCG